MAEQKLAWRGFKGRLWQEEINIRDFIMENFTEYTGDESFLEGPTDATNTLWGKLYRSPKRRKKKRRST